MTNNETNTKSLIQQKNNSCLLMFSGGRDSTLSAIRLYEQGIIPTLVTVTSGHLKGVDSVKTRIRELAPLLPAETTWLHVKQPSTLFTDQSFYEKTCLPCQHAYVVVAAKLARQADCDHIALGYTSYQGDWPEQTKLATACLHDVLQRYGIKLLLPVYEITSKDAAINELTQRGLSTLSLEQKCTRQIHNIALDDALLKTQVLGWEKAISDSIENLERIALDTISEMSIGSV